MQVVNILLERGADVDHEDKEGMTPLLVASFEGHRYKLSNENKIRIKFIYLLSCFTLRFGKSVPVGFNVL